MQPIKPKRIRAKGWFATWPKCPIGKEMVLAALQDRYDVAEYVICEEEHKDGDLHVHAFIKLSHVTEWHSTMFDVDGYHGNYQVAKSWRAVQAYVKKDGNYISNIDIPSAQKKKAKRNALLLSEKPKDLVDTGEICLLQLKSLIENKRLYKMLEDVPKVIERKCYWIYGEPRVGKSYCVRMAFDVYEKPMNKWWDGYAGEDVVLIDDFDKHGECLGHYMKIWADNYRFNAEVKGSTIVPTYKKLIVTSNYEIKDIFKDEEICKAIMCRFTMLKLYNREGQGIIIRELNK